MISFSHPSVFWSHVSKPHNEACWIWMKAKTENGYGRANRKGEFAHRIAWKLTNGDIPKGLFVLHKCDNPPCCNPEHLFLGTREDNMADMWNKGRGKLPPHKQFEENGQAKLTKAKASEIRTLRSKGWTYPQLANKFNVSRALIWQVLRGAVWRTPDWLAEQGL